MIYSTCLIIASSRRNDVLTAVVIGCFSGMATWMKDAFSTNLEVSHLMTDGYLRDNLRAISRQPKPDCSKVKWRLTACAAFGKLIVIFAGD